MKEAIIFIINEIYFMRKEIPELVSIKYANLKSKETDLQIAEYKGNLTPLDSNILKEIRQQMRELEKKYPDLII